MMGSSLRVGVWAAVLGCAALVAAGCSSSSTDKGNSGRPGMTRVAAGCFDMGDSSDACGIDAAECPVHQICITRRFYMDEHEVANREYAACVDAGSCLAPAFSDSASRATYYGDPTYDDFPVIYVSWSQAVSYCTWAGKRLPTEAEWEYAARGGLSGRRYPWGDSISGTDANYFNSGDPWDDDTSEIEYYLDNGYGLYDMAGNVSEWVNDWYKSDYYSSSPTNDPQGPVTGTDRVVRGGDWDSDTSLLRVSSRDHDIPTDQTDFIGFRCVAN